MSKLKIGLKEPQVETKFHITVASKGPYLLFGQPPMSQQIIMANEKNESWYFQQGQSFATTAQPTAICRCGASLKKPYCDGAHTKIEWDAKLTADTKTQPSEVEVIVGDGVTMTDDVKLCVFARFCHPMGDAWTLTEQSNNPLSRRMAIREASMCPSGRLTARDNASGREYEFGFTPSIGLIEDPLVGSSGGLWVRGGIPIKREDGATYQLRNRVVLCRCGASANKPYCDGTHVSIKWQDGLKTEVEQAGERLPEGVY